MPQRALFATLAAQAPGLYLIAFEGSGVGSRSAGQAGRVQRRRWRCGSDTIRAGFH
jgi:hypothetical protein